LSASITPRTDRVAAAREVANATVEEIIALTTAITEVPAPTNDEADRAAFVAEAFRQRGYADVSIDALSDVVAVLPGRDRSAPPLLLAAHIDTVFPRTVPIAVDRRGDTLHAPGVGDNSLSVAAVAHVAPALEALGMQPAVDVLVTGNVGEEGLGDLRGMRAVVDAIPNLGAAVAVEGHSLGRITRRAVGSKRLRITATGPGGHSWGDAGRPSAIHALAKVIARLDEIPLASDPKTSLNVGLFEGGISVNTIAPGASAVIDMRSTDPESLAKLVNRVEQIIKSGSTREVPIAIDVVGDRPAGEVPQDRGIVPIGVGVLKELGIEAVVDASSTDANVPIARGIPAMCIGLTSGGNVHREDEFIRIPPLATGFAQLLLVTLAVTEALGSGELS
jgi:acetylornithine deacetylase/succinyl-diaminopimelate desuccinylase-like protein